MVEDHVDGSISRGDVSLWWRRSTHQTWQNTCNTSPISNLNKIKQAIALRTDPLDHSDQRIITRMRIGHTRLTHTHRLKRNHFKSARFVELI